MEVFDVFDIGVLVLKFFLVEMILLKVIVVLCVVLLCDVVVVIVGGIMFNGMEEYYKVGFNSFGLGFVFYKFGYVFDDIVVCVWVFVSVFREIMI